MQIKFVITLVSAVLIFYCAEAKEIFLSNELGSAVCEADSLQLKLKGANTPLILVSVAQMGLGAVANIESTATTAKWDFISKGIQVDLRLEGAQLLVHVLSKTTNEFTFPIFSESDSTKGWILPLFEGVYAPSGDAKWISYLTNRGEMNTTEGLTMPFIGLDFENFTLTCIMTNPFNNQLTFGKNESGRLEARLKHQFTRNNPVKEYGVVFQIGKNFPVEPAKIYREWLMKRGEFVSLREKIKRTPEAEKLLGAPHVYLWGEELMGISDVLDWKQFAKELQAGGASAESSPARRIRSLLKPTARDAVTNLLRSEYPDKYTKSLVLEDLNASLLKRDFHDEAAWRGIPLSAESSALLKKAHANLTTAEIARLNCALLFAAFPKLLSPPEKWGNGVSPKMITELATAGFDRLWLGSGSWDGFINRPETVDTARKAGFLIGPYDSFHSMHSPKEADTWETAQFGAELYQTGAIVNVDGSKRHGFKKKGFLLSPVAARPFVEKRVGNLMNQFHANSWFIDCDGFGEYFDDYSEAHSATQLSDMLARNSRMAWIRDKFGAVIGTEGCSSGVASTVHFAHGVMTPVIGWGDPDLKDKKSKYYLGAYYPPSEPSVFFKTVPIKEEYRSIFYEPRFRLPLFQIVFHDSVIATHHWSNPSLKFIEVAGTVELLELLYNVPPLYHLNQQEFQKRKVLIKRHYDFFSPLHRELAVLPMTDFTWITDDRLVQQTTFNDGTRLIANFSEKEFVCSGKSIPKRSLGVFKRNGTEFVVYKSELEAQ